jgi:H+-transporting ATPase
MIAGLLLFNAILALLQESRSTAVLAALKGKLAPTALVQRDGSWARPPAAELAGDLVQLPLGALIPADARLLTGSLLVDQSMLTGESVPVDRNVGDLVYAGDLVRRGAAVAARCRASPS